MATKREIDMAKLAFFKGYSAGIGEKKECRMSKEQYAEIVDSIPHNIDVERKEFEEWFNSVLADASDSVPRSGTSWVFAGGAKHNAWEAWKAARGTEE